MESTLYPVHSNSSHTMSSPNYDVREVANISFPAFRPEPVRDLKEGYVLSAGYDGERKAAYLRLYEPRTGRIHFWYDNTKHLPYCFSDLPPESLRKIPDLMKHPGLDHIEVVHRYEPLKAVDVVVSKIVAKDPLSIGGRPSGTIRDILPKAWEADIRYYDCYLYDLQILMGMPYSVRNGELHAIATEVSEEAKSELQKAFAGETSEFAQQIDRWIELLQAKVPNIRRLALDIEVLSSVQNRVPDPEESLDPIVAISLVDSEGLERVFLLRRNGMPESTSQSNTARVEYFEEESELIKETYRILLEYPIVLTFNGDNFDLSYLYHRGLNLGFQKESIPIVLGARECLTKYGIHLDLYKFFFNRSIQIYAFGAKYTDVSLNGVAEGLLDEGKEELGSSIGDMSYDVLAAYCLKDSQLTLRLTTFDEDLVMKLIIVLARITRLPLEDLVRQGVSGWIKSMMYFEHRRLNYLIPRSEDILATKGQVASTAIIKGKKYKGAIVVNPVPGVHFTVSVLDFASLYPSIIKIHNLSYETILCPHPECRTNVLPGVPHWVCKIKSGVSSQIIGSLREVRVHWYKRKAKDKSLSSVERNLYGVVQLTLKVLLNASYGVMGAEAFSLYCPPLAEAVTAVGRDAIEKTVEKAKSLRIEVVYGDTDSIFLEAPTLAQIDELTRWSENELHLELEVDKNYRYAVFSNLKKNYLGVYPDGSVDIKGMTGKKRHMPPFLKQAFKEMTDILCEVKSPEDFEKAKTAIRGLIRNSYLKLRRREYPLKDLAFNVTMSRPPGHYTKTTPQHVKAALLLVKKGQEVKSGDVISFIKSTDTLGVRPLQLADPKTVNIEKYVEYLESTFDQVLDALGIRFDDAVGTSKLESFLWGK